MHNTLQPPLPLEPILPLSRLLTIGTGFGAETHAVLCRFSIRSLQRCDGDTSMMEGPSGEQDARQLLPNLGRRGLTNPFLLVTSRLLAGSGASYPAQSGKRAERRHPRRGRHRCSRHYSSQSRAQTQQPALQIPDPRCLVSSPEARLPRPVMPAERSGPGWSLVS